VCETADSTFPARTGPIEDAIDLDCDDDAHALAIAERVRDDQRR
jgi:hypothetical protein